MKYFEGGTLLGITSTFVKAKVRGVGVGGRLQLLARMTDTRRRVKVYTLNEDRQWDDRGTGHVSSGYVERLKGTSLLVRAESDGKFIDMAFKNTSAV